MSTEAPTLSPFRSVGHDTADTMEAYEGQDQDITVAEIWRSRVETMALDIDYRTGMFGPSFETVTTPLVDRSFVKEPREELRCGARDAAHPPPHDRPPGLICGQVANETCESP